MIKVFKWFSALLVIVALTIPVNATDLLDCIKSVEADFNACVKQAAVGGIIGTIVGGAVGLLGGVVGIGVGSTAGFLTGGGARAYACGDNFIRDSDECYAKYPLVF